MGIVRESANDVDFSLRLYRPDGESKPEPLKNAEGATELADFVIALEIIESINASSIRASITIQDSAGLINRLKGGELWQLVFKTGNIDAGTTSDLIITGHRSYMLQKVSASSAAWVRVYTDAASRDADTSRLHTEDASPGSGVIAEGYTTTSGITTFKMTPGVIGWNDDETPNRDIYLKVTNNETESADITVTLTIVRMEDA